MSRNLSVFSSARPHGFITAAVLLGGFTSSAWAATYTVGAGQTFATPEHIVWSMVHPGDTVVIYPGTYPSLSNTGNSMIVNGVVGTAANPIIVRGASSATLPRLNAGIMITGGSQYVYLVDLDVSRSKSHPYAAVVLEGRSSHIVLSALNVHDSFVGVQFTAPGVQNILQNSQIYGNVMSGVTPGPMDTSFMPNDANRSFISYNNIHDNGSHGIEITGPYYNVLQNHVTHNGLSTHGTSGIHLYSTSDVMGGFGCNNNRVLYNYVSAQQDANGVDGNGIQIDDFCNSNMVGFNVIWGNAGAGISVLDAPSNIIVANTSYENATDTARAASHPGVFRGEIVLGSMGNLCSNSNVLASRCLVAPGRSGDNVVYDNIVVSGQTTVPGIFVSPNAAAQNANHLYPNLYYNLGSATTGVQLSWNAVPYFAGTTIDSITGLSQNGGGNLVEKPSFVDATAPATGGLALTRMPTNQGWVVAPAIPDMSGAMPSASIAYYGAYYVSP